MPTRQRTPRARRTRKADSKDVKGAAKDKKSEKSEVSPVVVVKTNLGMINITLLQAAPISVKNFRKLRR